MAPERYIIIYRSPDGAPSEQTIIPGTNNNDDDVIIIIICRVVYIERANKSLTLAGSPPRFNKNKLDLGPIISEEDAVLDDVFSNKDISSIRTPLENDKIKYIPTSTASNDGSDNYIKFRENSLNLLLIFMNSASRERLKRLIISRK